MATPSRTSVTDLTSTQQRPAAPVRQKSSRLAPHCTSRAMALIPLPTPAALHERLMEQGVGQASVHRYQAVLQLDQRQVIGGLAAHGRGGREPDRPLGHEQFAATAPSWARERPPLGPRAAPALGNGCRAPPGWLAPGCAIACRLFLCQVNAAMRIILRASTRIGQARHARQTEYNGPQMALVARRRLILLAIGAACPSLLPPRDRLLAA